MARLADPQRRAGQVAGGAPGVKRRLLRGPLGASVDTSFILGMGKVKDDVKILLDIDKVLAGSKMAGVLESVAREPGCRAAPRRAGVHGQSANLSTP